jgi:SsrA-binding protein
MATLVENKKARLEYEIVENYEAGMALLGYEVKSLRAGKASLVGARVVVRGNEAYLVGATISPYQEKNTPKEYDPERTRRLLLSLKEINELSGSENQRGLTIIPIMVYSKGRNLKLQIAIVRHRKKHDKRAILKDRDAKRSINRTLKNEEA